MSGPSSKKPNGVVVTKTSAILGRLLWMAFGPLALSLLTFFIAYHGGGWLTGMDIGFFIVLMVTVMGRWMEHRSGQATTSYGEPAPPSFLSNYVAIMVPFALAAWTAANVLGNHVLSRD